MGVARLGAVLDAARRRHSVGERRCAPARPQLRARRQRLLSHRDRFADHTAASCRAQGGERLAVCPGLVRRAVRAARAPWAHSLSASGDDGVLMAVFGARRAVEGSARGELVEPRAGAAHPATLRRAQSRPEHGRGTTGSGGIRAAYDIWADTYPGVAHNPLMRLEQEIVESILRTLAPSRALDVGTGSGRYLPVLAQTGAARVMGVDFSMAMLRRADVAQPSRRGECAVGRSATEDERLERCATGVVCADARHLPVARRTV